MPLRRVLPLTVVALVALAACGGDDSSDDIPTPSDVSTVDTGVDGSGDTTDGTDTGDDTGKPAVDLPAEIPAELVVTVLEPGEGREAVDGDTVVVDYVGVLSEDGTEFDNSYDRGSPFPLTLGTGGVIAGWDEGLKGAQAGSRIQLDIPSELAYGETGSGPVIGPDAALTFVIDVRAVVGPLDRGQAPTDVDLPEVDAPEEVIVEDVTVGEGAEVAMGDSAWLAYIAYDADGKVLENSWDQGRPLEFRLSDDTGVPGLVEGTTGMRVGGRRIVVIPADQAFDGQGNEQLGLAPGEPLVMVIDLVAVS